jgi:hypothetical protein
MGATARSYVTAPDGLLMDDARVRTMLADGRAPAALAAVRDRKSHLSPDDELLRLLYEATAARYAGEHRTAGQLFDRAFQVSEDRFTKSVTRTATALLTNDFALPYTAGWSERLLLHYNALLAWSAAGDRGAAAVEARRLVALLARIAAPEQDERAVRALLHASAAAAFRANGDVEDARVAERNAVALGAPLDTVWRPIPVDSGDVIVAVERGFVAHKVAVGLTLPIFGSDNAAAWQKGGTPRDVTDRLLVNFAALKGEGLWWDDVPSWRFGGNPQFVRGGRVAYVLDMSWPVLRRPRPVSSLLPLVEGGTMAAPVLAADLSAAIAGDYRRDRGAIMARTLARATAKYLASEAVEAAAKAAVDEKKSKRKGKKKDDDDWGAALVVGIFGALANGAAMYLERADTRAWALLPGQVQLVRVRVAAGTQPVRVRIGDTDATIPAVEVRGGGTTVASVRLWRESRVGSLLSGTMAGTTSPGTSTP